ncbi:protein-serine,threonine phosphatase, partial [Sarracenia purpurea var. burkii]
VLSFVSVGFVWIFLSGLLGWVLASLGDKLGHVSGMLDGLIWSLKGGAAYGHSHGWPSEEPHADFVRCVWDNGSLYVARAIEAMVIFLI